MSILNVTTPDGIEHQVESGQKLSKICEDLGFPQDLVCGGNSKCGKCACEIEVNGVSSTVKSCQFIVEENLGIRKIYNRAGRKVNVLTANTALDCAINPALRSMRLAVGDFLAEHCGSFAEIIKEKFFLDISYPALKKLSRLASMSKPEKTVVFVIFKDTVIDVHDDTLAETYGLAIDIGTTTVAAYIYEMDEASLKGVYSSLNGQTALGADVISRISYCIKNEDGNDTMKELINKTINDLLGEAAADGIDIRRIYHVVLCGNSTMEHLFLNFYPENLGFSPFVSATHGFVEISARESGLNVNPEGLVTFLPLLGGFVGADTTAVLLGLPDDGKWRMAIDLGTNGEIAIGYNDRYITASTACGPALEGAGLTCGMRAAEGAVEHFKILPDKSLDIAVIGGGKKIAGICGSGIIDILAELIRAHVINFRGKMYSREEYEADNGEDALSVRLMKDEAGVNVFLLAEESESLTGRAVFFSQHDARQIQLAKGAIATGCQILVNRAGIDPSQLEEICLAGAFGNYLSVEQAQYIGLFPKFEGVPVRSVGNGAGTGVQMYLLDSDSVKKCLKVEKNVSHTELNFQEEFKDTYFDQMYFHNADDASDYE